jgi:hypothetical protein
MEHETAMREMRAHMARAGREIQSARQFLETPTRRGTNLALARALATASIDDAMDTIQQSLHERGEGGERILCEAPLAKLAEGEDLMAEQSHGRYYAQELMLDQDANIREQIQVALDTPEHQEWHLVGFSDVLPERGVILVWDTARPGFGSTTG